MKALLIFVNVALTLFTAVLLVTDPFPREILFAIFSLMLLAVPAVSAWSIHRKVAALAMLGCNLLLLAAMSWTVATQYASHPKEEGLLEFAILSIAVPLLNCGYFGLNAWKRGVRRSAVA